MQIKKLKEMWGTERGGSILILMVIVVFIVVALIWLDPMALMRKSGSGMPWNEEHRLVRPGGEVKQPKEGQPEITDNLVFAGAMVENGEVKGKVEMFILTDGRIKGTWGGKYNPEPNIIWEVAGSRFSGNIDPTKIYSDKDGEDPRKLYFIAKGNALIMVTNTKTDKIKTASGAIYVTGWLDNEYKAVGKVTITSNKKEYWEYYWHSEGEKTKMVPDFGRPLPGLY
jgi:hypothetical protein